MIIGILFYFESIIVKVEFGLVKEGIIMRKNYTKIMLQQFFAYYTQKVVYLEMSKGLSVNRVEDFKEWFKNVGNPIFEEIESALKSNTNKERICSLLEFYKLLLERNIEEDDFEGLIGNLYFVPEKMKSSFEKFHLINTNSIIEDNIKLTAYMNGINWGFKIEYVTGDLNIGSPILII